MEIKEEKRKIKRMYLKRIRLLTCAHSQQRRRTPVVFSVNFFTQRAQQKPAQYTLFTLSWASRIYCLKLMTAAGNYRRYVCLPIDVPPCAAAGPAVITMTNSPPTRRRRAFTVIDRVVDLGLSRHANTSPTNVLSSLGCITISGYRVRYLLH